MKTLAISTPGEIFQQGTFDWGTVTATGIQFKNGLAEHDWLELTSAALTSYEIYGKGFARSALYVADLLNYGEANYGERYAQAIDGTRAFLSRKEKTISNWRWIASHVDVSRRRENIDSLAVYEAVAALDPAEQDELLSMAETENLTASELNKIVRERHPKTKRGKQRRAKAEKNNVPIENITDAKLVATDLSNFLTENEDKITDAWKPLLGHFYKLFRRHWMSGHKR